MLSLYFSHKVDVCKYIDTKHNHRTPINKEFIDKYKINFFCSSKFFFVITSLFIVWSCSFCFKMIVSSQGCQKFIVL